MTASDGPRRKLGSAGRFWILLALSLVLGVLFSGLHTWLDHVDAMPGPILSAVILFVLFGVLIAATVWWWVRADEAVREAHKWAWYWGGSIGMCVGMGALLLAYAYGGEAPAPAGVGYGAMLFAGAALVLAPMLIGYGVAWFAWWISKGR